MNRKYYFASLIPLVLGSMSGCETKLTFSSTVSSELSLDSTSLSLSSIETTSSISSPVADDLGFLDCEMDSSLEGGYELVFCDDFRADTLNRTKWTPTNNVRSGSTQVYYADSTDNIGFENGNLVLTAKELTQAESIFYENMPFSSARLDTSLKFDFTYGRVVMRAKLAPGAGTWPGFWMMPTYSVYGNWPRSGEIDIMEYVGRTPNRVSSAYHTEKYNHTNTAITTIAKSRVIAEAETTFHTYELLWTSESLTYRIDGKNLHYYSYNPRLEVFNTNYHMAWPFDQAFHIIVNLGLGDAGAGGAGPIDVLALPTTYEIDYVKVYQIDYHEFDQVVPQEPENVAQSRLNAPFLMWDRAIDDYGIKHYEIWVDGEFYDTSTVNSYLFSSPTFMDEHEVSVRSVDFTDKKSSFVVALTVA